MRPRVEFWKKIYSKYTTRQVVIHDKNNLNIIYEVVDLKRYRPGSRSERKYVRKRSRRISAILASLYRKKGKAKSALEKEIASKWSIYNKGYKHFYKASKSVRGQKGQANRFREGLKRSGRYLAQMKSIFRSYGLPQELTALPHVESSFNFKAYSSAGAAGIWQFTRRTGKLYMRINYSVDERRDPILATHAAAKLLRHNYQKLGSWPLAITAYNHGLGGMKRAKKRHGSNITTIIDRYRSRSYGFASKNFYSEFLAALEVAGRYKSYFGSLDIMPPRRYDEIKLTYYISVKTLSRRLGISKEQLRTFNPALRQSVWKGHRRIPRGHILRVPYGKGAMAITALNALPANEKHVSQKHNGYHIVRRGDTLSTIAIHYRTSVGTLKDINNLRSHLIRQGQKLRIPGRISKSSKQKRTVAIQPNGKIYGTSYIVGRGDSLYSIARANGMQARELAKLNGLRLRGLIYPGQRLLIKKQSTAADSIPTDKIAIKRSSTSKSTTAKNTKSLFKDPKKPKQIVTAAIPQQTGPVNTKRNASIVPDVVKTSMANEPILSANGESVSLNGKTLKIISGDYAFERVRKGRGSLRVKSDETLGHYAEWAKTSASKIRSLNRARVYRNMRVGALIKIPLFRVSREEFEQKRIEYHMQLFEDFFEAYNVNEDKEVTVRQGQSLWDLCVNKHDAPIWLVRMYNENIALDTLKPGDVIRIPNVVKK